MAQDEVRNFRKPILTVETGGHHARVRSLVWQDEFTLLSGGEDKVVKVWDFHEGARLTRSIRPPVWRGAAGTIYAMAVTRPDAQGQSFLAVGGYGVENRRGDITIFRIPGLQRTPTGEVVARLLPPASENDDPRLIGHRNSVLCLAFDPSGRFLASGGHPGLTIHQTVILWERVGIDFRPRSALGETNRIGEVRALSFSPAGQHLATGGVDGALRLWDVNQGIQVGVGLPRDNSAINTLAFSPDGRFIVVGHEGGALFRFDVANLGQADPARFPTAPGQGPVESLAYSPDGRLLAVGIKSDRADSIEPMAIACDLEIRAMPAGDILQRRRVSGLIYASTFSPRGDRLAYSAGTAQAIYLQDPANLAQPAEQLRGQGSTPFDLGFSADSQVVGFTRTPFDPTRPPPVYDGFDFGRRKYRAIRREDLRLALKTYDGWSLEGSISQYVPELVNLNGRRTRLDLNRYTERNWWSWTFVPPGPGHTRPTVAVGCESGVVVYELETGRRTRVFAGHSSPVVSVVASPDGRWLASSSLDQTIMLYPLDGCDTRPAFGATFQQRPDQVWVASSVEPKSFAAGMGLLAGDVILKAGIAQGQAPPTYYPPEPLAGFVQMVNELRPGLDTIALWVRRTVWIPSLGAFEIAMPPMPSTKRNNAAITLMLGADKEWVVWTPQGFYDTSIEGDSRFLGWHVNSEFWSTRPTDFVPIVTYARTMFQPRVLDRLWQAGDLEQALPQAELPANTPAPERLAYEERPPRIIFTSVDGGIRLPAPGVVWLVNVPNPRLGLSIQAEGTSRIGTRRVIFDEHLLELPQVGDARSAITESLQVALVPRRRVRLAVEAASESGSKRVETMDMVYIPPPDAPAVAKTEPRLVVFSFGVDQTLNTALLPPIPFADKDASDLAGFLSAHLISPDGAKTLQDPKEERIVLTADKASERSINQSLGRLGEWIRAKRLRKGDIVAVVITAHVLEFDKTSVIAAADTDPGKKPAPGPVILARDISERLGELTDYGCRVVLFLDGVHGLAHNGMRSSIKAWVRDLQRERRVITFVASREGPSEVDVPAQHGYFALGLMRAFQHVVAAGKVRDEPYTLEEFGTAVRQTVLDLSGRQQEAFPYFPRGVPQDSLFARP
jgi:WD40 repeat protein